MIFDTHIRGVRHQNGAEQTIRNLRTGDQLTLKREPKNPYDKNAIGIWHGNTFLGYVPAGSKETGGLSARIAPLMDAGEAVHCIFHRSPDAIVLRTQSDC